MHLRTPFAARRLATACLFGFFSAAFVSGAAFLGGTAHAENAEKARQLFQEGSKNYDVGQFDRAIEDWQQGYEQKPDPSFLFNIAQAYRQKEDPAKAIFFYKSYLRNSPKAQNRADVEQRIAALQKQIDAGVKNVPAPAGTAPPPATPAPLSPTAPAPEPTAGAAAVPQVVAALPPPPATPPVGSAPENPPAVTASSEPPAVEAEELRADIGVGVGSDFWSSGVQGTADPSFAFTIGAGYRFASRLARLRFRLGALFGYTFLSEAESKETFLSFLVDPTLELRLDGTGRWTLAGDLGIGVMSISGLKPRSALLEQTAGQMLLINGSQGMEVTRLGLTLQWSVRPDLTVFAGPAVNASPKKAHFHAPITRFETTIGLAYRF